MKEDDPTSDIWLIKYSNDITYEGQINDIKREGYGTLKVPNKFIYTGFFKDDKFDGKGIYEDLENKDVF